MLGFRVYSPPNQHATPIETLGRSQYYSACENVWVFTGFHVGLGDGSRRLLLRDLTQVTIMEGSHINYYMHIYI